MKRFQLSHNFSSWFSEKNSSASSTVMCKISEIFFSSYFTSKISSLKRVPWQCSHSNFNICHKLHRNRNYTFSFTFITSSSIYVERKCLVSKPLNFCRFLLFKKGLWCRHKAFQISDRIRTRRFSDWVLINQFYILNHFFFFFFFFGNSTES